MKEITLSDIKSGMIGLSGGDIFIQRAIKFFTESMYSHSFTVMNGPTGLDVLETTSSIVCLTPMERKVFEKNTIDIWNPIAPQELKDQAGIKSYSKYSAMWYGYLSYLWFMYRFIAHHLGFKPTKMWAWASGNITCSELTCSYLSFITPEFAKIFEGLDLSAQSPEELCNILNRYPNLFEYVGRLHLNSSVNH